jgi:hypothetical protein
MSQTTQLKPISTPRPPEVVTLWDEEGREWRGSPLDARECLATGRYFAAPPSQELPALAMAETVSVLEKIADEQQPKDRGAAAAPEAVADSPDKPDDQGGSDRPAAPRRGQRSRG